MSSFKKAGLSVHKSSTKDSLESGRSGNGGNGGIRPNIISLDEKSPKSASGTPSGTPSGRRSSRGLMAGLGSLTPTSKSSGPAPKSRSSHGGVFGHTTCHSHHERDPEHDMESLHEMQDRLEGKVGVIQISGRYHRFPRNLSADYACTEKVLGTGFNGNVLMAEGKDRRDSKGELEKFAVKAFDFTGVPAARRSQLESEVEVFFVHGPSPYRKTSRRL